MTYSVFGGLIFLLVGVADMVIFCGMVYPAMHRRYEAAKTTGSHGMNPVHLLNLMYFANLFVLPIAGLLFGMPLEKVVGE